MVNMVDIDFYKAICERMIKEDERRNKAFQTYQEMFHSDWALPTGIAEIQWIHKVVNTGPHDAIAAAVRVIAGGKVRPRITPLMADVANRERANEIERILSYNLLRANDRRPATVQADMMQSACTYATIAAQVVDVGWQLEQTKKLGGNTRRWEAAKRYGRFMVNTFNPRDVHVRYSNYMPEAVLLYQMRSAQSIKDEWGIKGEQITKLIEANQALLYYDYMDYDIRAVWAEPQGGAKDADRIKIISPTPHEMPFLPWVALMGGSTLESDPEHAYHSLLYSVYQSGQWVTQNVVDTLRVSEAIANFAKPRLSQEGPNENVAKIDAGDPSRIAMVPAGSTLKELPANMLDPALSIISETLGGRMQQSTVSSILQGAETAPGEAFAALNLRVLTAIGALRPYTQLAQQGLSEVFALMLQWTEFTGESLTAFGTGKQDAGKMYVLEADEIDLPSLSVEVELAPDVPTDRTQKANTAIMLNNAGMYSKESGMEDIGVEDPQAEMEKIMLEQMIEAMFGMHIQSMQQEQEQQAYQFQQAQAQMAQQAEMMAGAGQMTNTGMGGMPPAQINPEMTREQMMGQTAGGQSLAEEMV